MKRQFLKDFIIRWKDKRITPLEVWDASTSKGNLWDQRRNRWVPERLEEVVLSIREGTCESRSRGMVPPECKGFDALFIGGGAAKSHDLHRYLSRLHFPVFVSEHGPFTGEKGGLAILDAEGCQGMVVDAGQTGLKVWFRGKKSIYPRDISLLSFASSVDSSRNNDMRRLFCEYAGRSMKKSAAGEQRPEAVVIALPCDIGPNGDLGESSYAGMAGGIDLVEDILKAADMGKMPVFLVNDAELAALSALQEKELAVFDKILVLTLGFGVGGALINRNALTMK